MSLDIWCDTKIDVGNPEIKTVKVSESFNITHNLIPMWSKAGCYDALYMSDEKEVSIVLPFLRNALTDMQDKPEEYKKLNPENGWGDYDGAKKFLERLISEFSQYPKAIIGISK